MRTILAISQNTFRESIRDRLLYNLLFFALLMIAASVLFATLTVGEQSRIIIDIGLASINIFGVLIAVFLGIGLISKEIEKRTIYSILAKPVPRYHFLIGKYGGLLITLGVNTLIMGTALYVVLMFNQWRWGLGLLDINPFLWKAVVFMFLEFMVMTAVAILFSAFTSSATLSAIFTISVYVIGHVTDDLQKLGEKTGDVLLQGVVNLIYYVLPNLDYFNIKGQVVHRQEVALQQMATVTAYGLLYVILTLFIAVVIFQRRDFR